MARKDGSLKTLSCMGVITEKGINTKERTVTGYASVGTIDRYKEIVDPKAFDSDLKRFLSERHLFAAGHQYVNLHGEPTIIGRITEGHIDERGLYITASFDSDDLSEKWWKKYESGTLNAFSIGFIPHAWEERSMEYRGKQEKILTYTEVELLEISAVPIPANRESMVMNGVSPEIAADFIKQLDNLHTYVKNGFNQILAQLAENRDIYANIPPKQDERKDIGAICEQFRAM